MDAVEEKKIKRKVTSISTQSERMSWNRKRKNIEKLIQRIQPLQDQIAAITAKVQPLQDDIAKIRIEMVKTCIHPEDLLIIKTNEDGNMYLECKFCNRKLVPKQDDS